MRLKGKVALVTGSNRGIGAGSVLEMAKEGADVAINYRSHAEEAEAVAENVRALGRRAIVIQGDVGDRAVNERLVEQTVQDLGRLDIFVANAVASVRKPFVELTPEDAEVTWRVALFGVFHGMQLSARQMLKQGSGGSIIVISSVHAYMPYRTAALYNAAKAGVNHMALTVANELAGDNIRVNIIEPGWTDTPGERQFTTDEALYAAASKLPMKRLATVEDIGRGVVYLASDDGGYITGANLRIDGGFVLPNHPS
ncbi:MAG: SDR family NAD(P)-dependent oxidoreductase [Acidobacteria bacterium]|nr:SDR family NAD(P)-dependent oxidoreductase [Acidobacteriota bacterium]